MELTENIESINKQLKELFGIDTISGLPMWRVVFSEDQFEKRYGTYSDFTPSGMFIRTVTEVREVPKYRQWIEKKYVLEHLCVIPDISQDDLPTTKVSYEPLWVFEDKNGKYLPPHLEASKFIIHRVHEAQSGSLDPDRYKHSFDAHEQDPEVKSKRVDGLIEELFGEQSSLQGTTKTGESIIVPTSYEKSN